MTNSEVRTKLTHEETIKFLKDLMDKDIQITQRYLQENGYHSYLNYISRYMGGLTKVKKEIGYVKKSTKLHNDNEIYTLLKKLDSEGINITSRYLIKNYKTQYGHIRNNMDGLTETLKQLGIKTVVKREGIKRTKRKWTKEEVITEMKKFIDSGEKLNSTNIINKNSSLYHACVNIFGSYKNTIEYLGINYNYISQVKKLTPVDIQNELRNLYEKGEDISSQNMQQKYRNLHASCQRVFGSYKIAIESINLNYDDIRKTKTWSKEKILNEIKSLNDKGEDLTSKYVSEKYNDLHHACKWYFNSYEEAVKQAGIDYYNITKRKVWSKEKVKNKLLDLHNEGISLTPMYLINNHSEVYKSCVNYFGSYYNALNEFGIDYTSIIMDNPLERSKGLILEKIIEKVFDCLSVTYITQERTHISDDVWIIPDFKITKMDMNLHNLFKSSPNQKLWIDSKLSYWTCFTSNTHNKYKDHCEKLVFIYLRGHEKPEYINDKMTNICIFELLPYIKDEEKRHEINIELLKLLEDNPKENN